jgi:hypothetical protein
VKAALQKRRRRRRQNFTNLNLKIVFYFSQPTKKSEKNIGPKHLKVAHPTMSQALRGTRFMLRLAKNKLNKVRSPILDQSLLLGRVLPGKTPYEEATGVDPRRSDVF